MVLILKVVHYKTTYRRNYFALKSLKLVIIIFVIILQYFDNIIKKSNRLHIHS